MKKIRVLCIVATFVCVAWVTSAQAVEFTTLDTLDLGLSNMNKLHRYSETDFIAINDYSLLRLELSPDSCSEIARYDSQDAFRDCYDLILGDRLLVYDADFRCRIYSILPDGFSLVDSYYLDHSWGEETFLLYTMLTGDVLYVYYRREIAESPYNELAMDVYDASGAGRPVLVSHNILADLQGGAIATLQAGTGMYYASISGRLYFFEDPLVPNFVDIVPSFPPGEFIGLLRQDGENLFIVSSNSFGISVYYLVPSPGGGMQISWVDSIPLFGMGFYPLWEDDRLLILGSDQFYENHRIYALQPDATGIHQLFWRNVDEYAAMYPFADGRYLLKSYSNLSAMDHALLVSEPFLSFRSGTIKTQIGGRILEFVHDLNRLSLYDCQEETWLAEYLDVESSSSLYKPGAQQKVYATDDEILIVNVDEDGGYVYDSYPRPAFFDSADLCDDYLVTHTRSGTNSILRLYRVTADNLLPLDEYTATVNYYADLVFYSPNHFVIRGINQSDNVRISFYRINAEEEIEPISLHTLSPPNYELCLMDHKLFGAEEGQVLFDLSNPDNPVLQGTYNGPTSFAASFSFDGVSRYIMRLRNGDYVVTDQNFQILAELPYQNCLYVGENRFIADFGEDYRIIEHSAVTSNLDPGLVPEPVILGNMWPNPFSGRLNIELRTQVTDPYRLEIYNLRGQRIRTISRGTLDKGIHSFSWDGLNDRDEAVGSGIYFVRASCGHRSDIRRIIKIRP